MGFIFFLIFIIGVMVGIIIMCFLLWMSATINEEDFDEDYSMYDLFL